MATASSISIFSIVVFFFSLSITTKATTDSFVVKLIHRDSPLSPFYDPKMTAFDRVISAADRSISRLNYLNSLTSQSLINGDISNKLVPNHGEYIMMFNVGNPHTKVYAIADTASEIIWFKCLPCKNCNSQSVPPIFDPSKSVTFERALCTSSTGDKTQFGGENHERKYCNFYVNYIDGSKTNGTLSYDEFTFEGLDQNSIISVGYLIFGCAEDSSANYKGMSIGIVGLNRLRYSLVSQLGIAKFSYCMVAPEKEGSGSRMYFGSQAVIAGGQTPFDKSNKIYYHLTLKGISIGDEKVPIPDGVFDKRSGGFIIDSGATYTHLKTEAFGALVGVLIRVTNLPILEYPPRPFQLCFAGSFSDLEMKPDIIFHFLNTDVILNKQSTYVNVGDGDFSDLEMKPDIIFHFLNTDVILNKQSTYVNVGDGDFWCLAMMSTSEGASVFGNTQQQNYWVGYDLEEGMVSFAPVECATF